MDALSSRLNRLSSHPGLADPWPKTDPMQPHKPSLSLLRLAFLLLPALWLILVVDGPVQWADSGYFIHEASHGPLFSMQLGALSHPTYHLLMRLVHEAFGPWGVAYINPALAIPLTWMLFRLGRAIGLDPDWASIAAVCACLAHCSFWVGSKVEVYSLHLLLVLAAHWVCFDDTLRLSLNKRLISLGLLTGLAVSTHQLTLVVLLPLYLFMLVRARAQVCWVIPGLLVGLAPVYPGLVQEMSSGKALHNVIRHYLTGHAPTASADWESAFGRFDLMWRDKSYVAIWALSLLGVQAAGLWPVRRDPRTLVLWSAAAMNALFAMSYAVSDRYTFFLPGAAMLALLACVRLQARLHGQGQGWIWAGRGAALASPLLLIAVWASIQMGWLKPPVHTVSTPPRDDVRYFMVPYLPDRSASVFVQQQMAHTPAGAWILADYTPLGALTSASVAGLLPTRHAALCDTLRGQPLPSGQVFLVRETYCDHMRAQFQLQATPAGWRVR
jgi:Protein of unknown function (DUF2723)